jgi:hypothetical protein
MNAISKLSEAPTDAGNAFYPIPRSGRPFPAIVGLQGRRLATFTTQIRPFDIEDVLGHDPRSRNHKLLRDAKTQKLYEHVQRKTSEERVRDMICYYRTRVFCGYPILGAVPAISIAVEQPIAFKRLENHEFLGEMYLETGRSNRRIVLDGLGRVTGLLDLVDLLQGEKLSEEESNHLQSKLDGCLLPVVFFAPQNGQKAFSQDEMEQIFCDFNFKVRPVSPKDAIALDHSDPYVEITRFLDTECRAIGFFGGMEKKAASLGSKSTSLVVQPVLLRFVRGAIEGEGYLEAARNASVDNPNLTPENAEVVSHELADFLDALAISMGDEKWADRSSMHLSSPGWQVLGLLYHDMRFRLKKSGDDIEKFAGEVARLDWRRGGEIFSKFMTKKVDSRTGKEVLALNSAGASVRRELIKNLRGRLGLTPQLSSDEAEAA